MNYLYFYILTGWFGAGFIGELEAAYNPNTAYFPDANIFAAKKEEYQYLNFSYLYDYHNFAYRSQAFTYHENDCKKAMWAYLRVDPFWMARTHYMDQNIGSTTQFPVYMRENIWQNMFSKCSNDIKDVKSIKTGYAKWTFDQFIASDSNIALLGPYLFLEVLYKKASSQSDTSYKNHHNFFNFLSASVAKRGRYTIMPLGFTVRKLTDKIKQLSDGNAKRQLQLALRFYNYFFQKPPSNENQYHRLVALIAKVYNKPGLTSKNAMDINEIDGLLSFSEQNQDRTYKQLKKPSEIACSVKDSIKDTFSNKTPMEPYKHYCKTENRSECFVRWSREQLAYTFMQDIKKILEKTEYANNCKK
jgi:hypothetical protein